MKIPTIASTCTTLLLASLTLPAFAQPPSEKPCTVPAPQAPESAWAARDKRIFTALLKDSNPDLLVLPVQVRGCGFDRSTRSLMTAQLAQAFEAAGISAANPYAVQRALGENLRQFSREDVDTLVRESGAKRVLTVHAGHEMNGQLLVTAQLSGGPPASFTAPIGPDDAVYDVFEARMLTGILILAKKFDSKRAVRVAGVDAVGMPESPVAAADTPYGSPNEAVVAQVLGMLAPARSERISERHFEQSLLALPRFRGDEDSARLLRARAAYYLHSRPAALAALGTPRTPAQEAFKAFLDGNLPDLERALARIDNEVFLLFAAIEHRDLQREYGAPIAPSTPESLSAFARTNRAWMNLVARRLGDTDSWHAANPMELNELLDRIAPIPEFNMAARLQGAQALGKRVDPGEWASVTFDHVARAREAKAGCAIARSPCLRFALLDLAEGLAIRGIEKAIVLRGDLQALPADADELARQYSKILDGNAQFALARVRAEYRRYGASAGDARERSAAFMRSQAATAMYWEGGQSRTSRDVRTVGTTPAVSRYVGDYDRDIPMRPFWPLPSPIPSAPDEMEKLRQSTSDIGPVLALKMVLKGDALAEASKSWSDRFRGHPQRSMLAVAGAAPAAAATAAPTASAAATPTASDAAKAVPPPDRLLQLKAAIAERPDLWENYRGLGVTYLEQGNYAEAVKAFLSFPGFVKSDGYHPVALSNAAYEAGSQHYFRGDFDNARKLYRISAGLRTGSAASISSAGRLHLMDGRLVEGVDSLQEGVARYDDPTAQRDLLSMMFAFGHATQAWAGFDQLYPTAATPYIWSAAHVGHHVQRKDWPTLRKWLLQDRIRTAGESRQFALLEAVMLNVMDRMPADDLVITLTAIEDKPVAAWEALGGNRALDRVTRPHLRDPKRGFMSYDTPALRKDGAPRPKNGDPVASHLVFFAKGYLPLRKGDFKEAVARFDEMAQVYPIDGNKYLSDISYPLAYYAWAAAKSGDPTGLEVYLDRAPVVVFARFDRELAKAFFTGLRGDAAKSVAHLERAFNVRPSTEWRPIFTEYQWAEACEWLYLATKDPKYRDLALRGTRAARVFAPYSSWPYAMEAKLAIKPEERMQALGYALFLDAGSERLAGIPEKEKQAAAAWFARNNPFKETPAGKRTASN